MSAEFTTTMPSSAKAGTSMRPLTALSAAWFLVIQLLVLQRHPHLTCERTERTVIQLYHDMTSQLRLVAHNTPTVTVRARLAPTRHVVTEMECPRKRTSRSTVRMSALCQKRTFMASCRVRLSEVVPSRAIAADRNERGVLTPVLANGIQPRTAAVAFANAH